MICEVLIIPKGSNDLKHFVKLFESEGCAIVDLNAKGSSFYLKVEYGGNDMELFKLSDEIESVHCSWIEEEMIFEVDFNVRIHCDECLEPTGFQFETECPVCNSKRAWTDWNSSPYDCLNENNGLFSCTRCNSEFKILEYDYCNEPEAKIELISKGETK